MKIKANILSHSLEEEFYFKKEIRLSVCLFMLIQGWIVLAIMPKRTYPIYGLLVIGMLALYLIVFIITTIKAKRVIAQRIIGTLECTPMYLILNIPNKEIWIDENFEGRLVLNFKIHKGKSIQPALIHQLAIINTQKTEQYYFVLERSKQNNIQNFIDLIDGMNINYWKSIGGR